MSIDLDELEQLAKNVTPVPWHDVMIATGIEPCATGTFGIPIMHDRLYSDDAAYIAAVSPDVVLALIAEVRRLREIRMCHRRPSGCREGGVMTKNDDTTIRQDGTVYRVDAQGAQDVHVDNRTGIPLMVIIDGTTIRISTRQDTNVVKEKT